MSCPQSKVKIVNAQCRGELAILDKFDVDTYDAHAHINIPV